MGNPGRSSAIWDNMTPRGALTLAPDQQFVLRCKRCGDRYVLALPCSIAVLAAALTAYSNEHQHPGEAHNGAPSFDEEQVL